LDVRGYIVVLEAGDNVYDLGSIGLNRENGGLLGSCPEYIELLDIGEGLQAYRIALLYDNDHMMMFFTLVERINELKSKYDVLANRKSEAERQLDENQAEPIPLQLVRKALSDFNRLLQTSPVETLKTLIQTVVKQIAVQQGQKLRGIELEFDETLRQCLVIAAPSTDKVDGAFFVQAQIPIALHDHDLVHLPLQSENTVRSAFTASIDTSDTFLSQPRGSLLRSRSPLPSVGCDEDGALKIR